MKRTLSALSASILAGSMMAGPAYAGCGLTDITKGINNGRTYQVLVTSFFFENRVPCGFEGAEPCPGIYAISTNTCEWRITSPNQTRGTAQVRITCPGEKLDPAGITNFGPLPPERVDLDDPLPRPFWLDQDKPYRDWALLPAPKHELRRVGSSCKYLLDDVNNPDDGGLPGRGPSYHDPYIVSFSSVDAENFHVVGRRLDPAAGPDFNPLYGVYEQGTGLH